MNKKFFYYALTLASVFLIFVNSVSPEFFWSKIIFFFIIFCFFFSVLCIFSQKYSLNSIKALYFTSLILLLFFHQFNLLNIILLSIILIAFLFFVSKKTNQTKSVVKKR
ncbi:MAG: hypothetical protein PHP97_00710 [Candidatus Shapirobacteria bacterium]|nr:hypothetical protein [Candidatus Shapirobacteria bacterium]MDD3002388.1 hypothetical protein [Candidatus Shapirobacteria bacterium]MDD4383304.1 hypothetical protein [Candidatus Shapirobacteria bacterium]